MTTLVGICAREKTPGVVLASDLSRTETTWKPEGDIAYKQQTRSEGQKIYVNDDKTLAVCMTGVFDSSYINFLTSVLKGKVDVEKALKEGFFREFKALNESRWEGKMPDNNLNGLLIASRFDKQPKLYTCFPLGRVEEKYWTSVGSGSDYALNHLRKQDKLIPGYANIRDAVRLASSSLDVASQDIYTGGMDLVIVTPTGIKAFGETIRAEMNSAKSRAINKITRGLKRI